MEEIPSRRNLKIEEVSWGKEPTASLLGKIQEKRLGMNAGNNNWAEIFVKQSSKLNHTLRRLRDQDSAKNLSGA
jgi:hypothetical protein